MDPYQSAYRMQSSSETALLKVASDLYDGMDDGWVSILVILDISVAFDTIDASILLERMEVYFGVTGRALQWLSFYLTQCVKVDGVLSPVSILPSGVPQGSVLGPVLFSAFIAPLADVIDSFHISHHQYADDTNLYHSFSASDQQSSLEDCIKMLEFSEQLVSNTWFTCAMKVDSFGVEMGGSKIPLSDKIKSLGVVFDQRLTFENHAKAVCRTCYFHIKSLRVLRPSLDTVTAEIIGRSIIMSMVGLFFNSLLAFTSLRNIHRLQMVQNQLARVVSGSGYRQNAAPILFCIFTGSLFKEELNTKL